MPNQQILPEKAEKKNISLEFNPTLYIPRAVALWELGRCINDKAVIDLAQQVAEGLIAAYPYSWIGYYLLSEILAYKEDFALASYYLKTVVRLKPMPDIKLEILTVELDQRSRELISSALKPKQTSTYPLAVPAQAQREAEDRYGQNRTLTEIRNIGAFDLRYPEKFLDNHYDFLRQKLELLRQLFGRAPPRWGLVITTDLSLTQGNVAACDIAKKIVFIHPYFFELTYENLIPSEKEAKQLEILCHELISHITKRIRNEDNALMDTRFLLDNRDLFSRISKIRGCAPISGGWKY